MQQGAVIVKGIGIGKIIRLEMNPTEYAYKVGTVEEEKFKLETAINESNNDIRTLKDKASESKNEKVQKIMEVHEMLLSDEELTNRFKKAVEAGVNALESVERAIKHFEDTFEKMEDQYFKERSVDIRDIGNRLRRKLTGSDSENIIEIQQETILVSDEIQPSIVAEANPKWVKGIITKLGGETSHAAIMCKASGIPLISGVNDLSIFKNGDEVILDALNNQIHITPNLLQMNHYKELIQKLENVEKEMNKISNKDILIHGEKIKVYGNIAGPDDLRYFSKQKTDGIGLYRTEFVFLKSVVLPTEDEQFEAYVQVVKAMGTLPVTLRTIDIGGDKKLGYLDLGVEDNPFLGYRAIRFCLEEPHVKIFRTQLRAMLRCLTYGNVKIMFPMITTVDELKLARKILKDECLNLNINSNHENLSVGIMVEVPSVAICAESFAPYVDFFSIGTNDLTQYTLAVDRMNSKLKELYSYFNPAVLKLVQQVIEVGIKSGVEVSICGEMASNPLAVPLLAGMGLNKFSVSPSFINRTKYVLNSIKDADLKVLTKEVLQLESANDVLNGLNRFQKEHFSGEEEFL